MKKKLILNHKEIEIILKRLAMELIENHNDFSKSAIIGLQPRGVFPARSLVEYVKEFTNNPNVLYGELDHTFFRDDFRRGQEILTPHPIKIDFDIEGKNIILVDDVVYTGRSVRSAMDALSSYGRPSKIELLALLDRRFNRETPIMSDYCGKVIDTRGNSQKVLVDWNSKKINVWLLNTTEEE
ncbi:MAG: bifunctional pyr operon transcriptional regulator/uracil phosphoribosyltransferase PyrR [Bacteroidia bacterium]|nr:bifunctional pyr operon transcriptional regulator/uracil phosphoribosyltransferase PyrR [Bacteroidia bacterium]MCO5254023.1 bifunctional pyr operon transcriptional regulator/uracil phosphoribosyltransferase PyrR [Bacteroidota bacterium]